MSLNVECPDCFQSYRFKESASGRRFKCRECGRKFRISEASLDEIEDLPELKQTSVPAAASAKAKLPPRAGKARAHTRSTSSDAKSSKGNFHSGQMYLIMGILCLVHSSSTVLFGWRSFRVLMSDLQNLQNAGAPSLMYLLHLAAAVAFVAAGIGLLRHADWAVQLACITAAAMLLLLGIGIVISIFRMTGSETDSTLGIVWIGTLLTGVLRSAAIPGIVLWWTMQE